MKALLEPEGFSVVSYDPYFFPRFPEGPFDFILCSEAAEHFYAPAEEFARIDAILKPGGVLGVSSWLLPPLEKFEDWSYRRDKTHVGFFSETSVRWLARARGWEILALESPLWILRKS
jgi:SAM-dependent methyltransferase